VTEILKLTPERPLVGNRYGKHFKSHWIVYLKLNAALCDPAHGDAGKPETL
jgi:hypothetical protein